MSLLEIQTEKVFEAALDHVYSNSGCEYRGDCPVLEAMYQILERMKTANNQEIMEQIGLVNVRKCDHPCKRR
jgi:hypothetical protein